jgi:hypothetical protein
MFLEMEEFSKKRTVEIPLKGWHTQRQEFPLLVELVHKKRSAASGF